MRRLLQTVVVLFIVALAWPAEAQSFRVKTPKGDLQNLGFAVNPDNCDLLVLFENGDRVHAALMKMKNGKYKGKKAKPISGSGEAHRAYGMFRLDDGEFLVAWDTAPGDLDALARRSPATRASSVIRLQRLRSSNGKTIGAARSIGNPDRVSISPYFFSVGDPELGDAGLMWVEYDDTAARAAGRAGATEIYEYPDGNSIDTGTNMLWYETPALGPVRLTSVKRISESGEVALAMDVIFGGGQRSAQLFGREPGAASLEGPFNTPSRFPDVDTSDAGYTRASLMNFGFGTYNEGGRGWGEFFRAPDWDAFNGAPIGGFDNPAETISHPAADNGFGTYQGRVPRQDVVYVAGQQGDGTVRLFRASDAGVDAGQVLFRSNRTIEQMRLILMPDSDQAVLLWIEQKNRNTDQIRGLLFDIE